MIDSNLIIGNKDNRLVIICTFLFFFFFFKIFECLNNQFIKFINYFIVNILNFNQIKYYLFLNIYFF